MSKVWKSCDEIWVAPIAPLPMLTKDAHGVDYCNKRAVATRFYEIGGHVIKIHISLYSQVKDAVQGEQVIKEAPNVEPGDYIYIKLFKRKQWKEPQREGPFKVVAASSTAVKFKGNQHWHHLNHCCCAEVAGQKHSRAHPKRTQSDIDTDSDGDDYKVLRTGRCHSWRCGIDSHF